MKEWNLNLEPQPFAIVSRVVHMWTHAGACMSCVYTYLTQEANYIGTTKHRRQQLFEESEPRVLSCCMHWDASMYAFTCSLQNHGILRCFRASIQTVTAHNVSATLAQMWFTLISDLESYKHVVLWGAPHSWNTGTPSVGRPSYGLLWVSCFVTRSSIGDFRIHVIFPCIQRSMFSEVMLHFMFSEFM